MRSLARSPAGECARPAWRRWGRERERGYRPVMRLLSLAACLSSRCPVKRLSGLAACAACALSAILSGVGGPSARWLDFGRYAGGATVSLPFCQARGHDGTFCFKCQASSAKRSRMRGESCQRFVTFDPSGMSSRDPERKLHIPDVSECYRLEVCRLVKNSRWAWYENKSCLGAFFSLLGACARRRYLQ